MISFWSWKKIDFSVFSWCNFGMFLFGFPRIWIQRGSATKSFPWARRPLWGHKALHWMARFRSHLPIRNPFAELGKCERFAGEYVTGQRGGRKRGIKCELWSRVTLFRRAEVVLSARRVRALTGFRTKPRKPCFTPTFPTPHIFQV